MDLRKILTLLFAVYGVALLGFLIVNSQFLFIEDVNVWSNVVIINLIFMVIFFLLGLIMVSNLQSKIKNKNKVINELKGRLYDSLKDDESREKMLKDFEKSLK